MTETKKLISASDLLKRAPGVGLVVTVVLLAASLACGSKPAPQGQTRPTAIEAPAQTMRLPRIEALMPSAVPKVISRAPEGWRLKSSVQYGYAAIVPFDGFGVPGINGTVDVRFRLAAGRFAIGIITASDQITQEQIFEVSDSAQRCVFNMGTSELKAVVFLSVAPNGTSSEMQVQGVDYIFSVNPIPNAVSLGQASVADPAAALSLGPPLHVTAGQKYGYAATIPLSLSSLGKSLAFLKIHARVMQGRMGFGILNKLGTAVTNEHYYDAAPNSTDYVVAIPAPDDAGRLVLRSDSSEKSEVAIGDIAAFRVM